MNKPVRIGIVGCGRVMQGPYMSLAEKLQCRGELEVVIASDVKPEVEQTVTNDFGIPRFTTNYKEVIENPDVDAVLVLTSMLEHGAIAREALEAGKHTLVEKPMAVELSQAEQLINVAEESGLVLVCAPHVIHSPTYRRIWEHIQRGHVGTVNLARARYGWSGPNWGPWFYKPGGGALFDLGIYNVVSLAGLVGSVQRVTAMVGTAIPRRVVDGQKLDVEVDDNAHLLLDFGGSRFAVVTTGFTMQKYRSPAIELYGTEGTIQMLGDDWNPDGYEMYQNIDGAWKVFEEPNPYWPWTDGLRHLIECIKTGRRSLSTPQHAFHALEIMLKAKESARDGTVKEISSSFPVIQYEPLGEELEKSHRIHDRSYPR